MEVGVDNLPSWMQTGMVVPTERPVEARPSIATREDAGACGPGHHDTQPRTCPRSWLETWDWPTFRDGPYCNLANSSRSATSGTVRVKATKCFVYEHSFFPMVVTPDISALVGRVDRDNTPHHLPITNPQYKTNFANGGVNTFFYDLPEHRRAFCVLVAQLCNKNKNRCVLQQSCLYGESAYQSFEDMSELFPTCFHPRVRHR